MKTLDEVIFEVPYSPTPWEADALHYLKEYRKLDSLDTVVFPEDDNPPLTWDELKTMEGNPVWMEVYDPIDEKTGWHTASWKLIEFINDEYFDVRDSDGEQECFYKSENDWQAYRKERI